MPRKWTPRSAYAGQVPRLFSDTLGDNIALGARMTRERVREAVQLAVLDPDLERLERGLDTLVGARGVKLSGGQIQRIGLARALYNEPVIVVLDEPNSNLDNEGSQALNTAIRQMKEAGKSVLIMAHRPAAIQECDTLLVMENGTRMAFGPKDEVLKATVRNHEQLAAIPGGRGGVS